MIGCKIQRSIYPVTSLILGKFVEHMLKCNIDRAFSIVYVVFTFVIAALFGNFGIVMLMTSVERNLRTDRKSP